MKQFLARDIEGHKARLSTAAEREIESLKAELRRIAYEHETMFQKLHAERAEAIKLLYQKALALGTAGRHFASGEGVNDADDFQKSRAVIDQSLNDFYRAMFENRIFLSEHLCVKIDEFVREIIPPASGIAGGYLIPLRSDAQRLEARLSDKRKLQEATWRLEAELAAEFRKLLGANDNEPSPARTTSCPVV